MKSCTFWVFCTFVQHVTNKVFASGIIEFGSIYITYDAKTLKPKSSSVSNETILQGYVGTEFYIWCISTKPLKWTSTGKTVSRLIEVTYNRQMTNLDLDKQTYKNTLALNLGPDSRGIYRCEQVFDSSTGVDFQIYTKRTEKIISQISTIPFNSIYIPCFGSDPTFMPILQKIPSRNTSVGFTYEPLYGFKVDKPLLAGEIFNCQLTTNTIIFKIEEIPQFLAIPSTSTVNGLVDSEIRLSCVSSAGGLKFTHTLSNNKTMLASYTTNHGRIDFRFQMSEDNVSVTCYNEKYSHKWLITLDQNSSIKYYSARNRFECYATNLTDTQVANYFCQNQNDCEMKRKCHEDDSCTDWVRRGLHCHYKYKSCLKIDNPFETGIIRCFSDGFSVEKLYFTGIDRFKYFIDEEAPNHAKLKLEELEKTFYREPGKTLILGCTFIKFFFSESAVFAIRYKNGTVIQLEDGVENYEWRPTPGKSLRDMTFITAEITPSLDIVSIICMAPYQNSLSWFNVSRDMSVIDVEPPKITNLITQLNFYVGDEIQVVNCETSGEPRPHVNWMKTSCEGDDFNSNYTGLKLIDGSILTFNNITLDAQGNYYCFAQNFGGYYCQKFTVNVTEVNVSSNTIGITIGISLSLILILTIIALYYWNRHRHTRAMLIKLSEKDIEDFFNGNSKMLSIGNMAHENAKYMPYNNFYEIPKTDIQIDQNNLLGKGMYGIVFGGSYNGTPVAIKTVWDDAELSYFKALLSELKVMMYIGYHPNIVEFLGANTSGLRDREVYIIVELLKNGNLVNYLRKNTSNKSFERDSNVSKYEPDYANTETSSANTGITIKILLNWSSQIASGMEHLAKRKIIHGDLAARNILLDDNLQAKVTDFGLSRQLYEYQLYIKKQKSPLPWKWMALESLNKMTFSSASDAWSYAITVWEMFSLGATPYPGVVCDPSFMDNIANGMRLNCPKLCPESIYSDIMLQCWNPNPEKRPTFTAMVKYFQNASNVHELQK